MTFRQDGLEAIVGTRRLQLPWRVVQPRGTRPFDPGFYLRNESSLGGLLLADGGALYCTSILVGCLESVFFLLFFLADDDGHYVEDWLLFGVILSWVWMPPRVVG